VGGDTTVLPLVGRLGVLALEAVFLGLTGSSKSAARVERVARGGIWSDLAARALLYLWIQPNNVYVYRLVSWNGVVVERSINFKRRRCFGREVVAQSAGWRRGRRRFCSFLLHGAGL